MPSRAARGRVVGGSHPTMDLEPVDPETALELSLAAKESEYAASTIGAHGSRLEMYTRASVDLCVSLGS